MGSYYTLEEIEYEGTFFNVTIDVTKNEAENNEVVCLFNIIDIEKIDWDEKVDIINLKKLRERIQVSNDFQYINNVIYEDLVYYGLYYEDKPETCIDV